jgi:hypothetical protein
MSSLEHNKLQEHKDQNEHHIHRSANILMVARELELAHIPVDQIAEQPQTGVRHHKERQELLSIFEQILIEYFESLSFLMFRTKVKNSLTSST